MNRSIKIFLNIYPTEERHFANIFRIKTIPPNKRTFAKSLKCSASTINKIVNR